MYMNMINQWWIEQHVSSTLAKLQSVETQVSCSVVLFAATEGEFHLTDSITMEQCDTIFGHASEE